MFSGSLALLAQAFPGSRLRFDQFGRMLGEQSFGRSANRITGALEGLLFAAGIVGAMLLGVAALCEATARLLVHRRIRARRCGTARTLPIFVGKDGAPDRFRSRRVILNG